jgi:hypothetical protein
MKRYAGDHGIAIDLLAEEFVRSGAAERRGNQTEADAAFIRILVNAVRSKKAAA